MSRIVRSTFPGLLIVCTSLVFSGCGEGIPEDETGLDTGVDADGDSDSDSDSDGDADGDGDGGGDGDADADGDFDTDDEDPLLYTEMHFVTENGGDPQDGRTLETAWSVGDFNSLGNWDTTVAADGHIGPGDLVRFSGTITTQIVVQGSGVDGEYITLNGEDSVLTGQHSDGQINIEDNKDYIIVDGFECDGTGNNGTIGIQIVNDCDYIHIVNCEIHDITSENGRKCTGIYANAQPRSRRNSNITVGGNPESGNLLYNIGVDTGDGDTIMAHTDHIIFSYNVSRGAEDRSSGIDGITLLGCDSCLIENNSLHGHQENLSQDGVSDFGEDGIDLKGSTNVIVRYNYLANNRSIGVNVNLADSIGAICSDVVIHGNWIEGNGTNVRVNDLNQNVYIFSNLIRDSETHQGISCSATGIGYRITNNTIVNCHGDGSRFGIVTSNGSDYLIENNILTSDTHNDLMLLSGSDLSISNNHYFYTDGEARIGLYGSYKSVLTIDPQGTTGEWPFVEGDGNDYRLLATTLCRNSGVPTEGGPPPLEIQGVTHQPSYAEALHPESNFFAEPPSVVTGSQEDFGAGWERGAFLYVE